MKKMTILKRLGAVAVSGVLMASMLAGCGAKDSSSSDGGSKKESSSSAVEAIKERGVLKVGTEDSAIGFGYLNPDTNEWEGLEVDLGKLIADELGVDVEYTAVTTSTRGQLLDSGDLDLVAATFNITDERKLSYDF